LGNDFVGFEWLGSFQKLLGNRKIASGIDGEKISRILFGDNSTAEELIIFEQLELLEIHTL
jgi:hypothetical protein